MESPPHLPEELVILILARLPPSSALRFQNVCKSWRSIVSSPGFLERSILLQCKRREPSLVIAEARRVNNVGNLIDSCYTVLESPTSLSPTEFGQLWPLLNRISFFDFFVMVGSCRGVVCLAGLQYGRCVLWNPTTGELRELLDHDSDQRYGRSLYNIGFSHFDGDFKVVKITNTQRNYYEEYTCVQAKIYKLSLGYWREISTAGIDSDGIEPPDSGDSYMVCWRDGKMCSWVTNNRKFVRDNRTSTYSFMITSFDMSNDTFTSFSSAKVPLSHGIVGLLALNDLLAFWWCYPPHRHQMDGTNMDIWVMLQHGVVESWAKLWSIRVGPEPHWPKVIWNGGLVMKKRSEDSLLWCDLSNSPCIIQTLPVFAFSSQAPTRITKVFSFEKTRTSLESS